MLGLVSKQKILSNPLLLMFDRSRFFCRPAPGFDRSQTHISAIRGLNLRNSRLPSGLVEKGEFSVRVTLEQGVERGCCHDDVTGASDPNNQDSHNVLISRIIARNILYLEDCIMNVILEISIGEFFDKLTILEIKKERIPDEAKLVNINRELDALNALLDSLPFSRKDVESEVGELKAINEKLWVIEDDIRDKEAARTFDQAFIELARSVYFTNDRRSEVKRDINIRLGSDFIEEKSYEEYQ